MPLGRHATREGLRWTLRPHHRSILQRNLLTLGGPSMNNMTLDMNAEPLDLEVLGRRFPADWGVSRSQTKVRPKQLKSTTEQRELKDLVDDAIWGSLAWVPTTTAEVPCETLVASYIQSLNQLDRYRRDVDGMIRAACIANLEFRQEQGETHAGAKDAVVTGKLKEMLQSSFDAWMPVRNVVDARLVSRPKAEIQTKLESALKQAVADFCQQFFDLLARMVDQELFGLVEWLPNNCCAYHFFRRVIIQENEGASERVSEERFRTPRQPDRGFGRQIVGRRTIEQTKGKGRHIHRFARHQHDVMQAIHTSIRDSRVVMPPSVQHLCETVPSWLYPFVQVIDGTIIRERIIERDATVDHWTDTQIRDEPIIGYEPAVIIGAFVLTGWGPREVQAEIQRREAVARDDAAKQAFSSAATRWPWLVTASLLLAVASMSLTLVSNRGSVSQLLALICIGGTLLSIRHAAFDRAIASRNSSADIWSNLTTASIGSQFLTVLWVVAGMYRNTTWFIPAGLIAIAVVCHFFSRIFR